MMNSGHDLPLRDCLSDVINRKIDKGNEGLNQISSFKGRLYCFGNLLKHSISIPFASIAYIFDLVLVDKPVNKDMRHFEDFCCIFIAPLCEIAQAIRSLFGIIHPGAYYRGNPPPKYTPSDLPPAYDTPSSTAPSAPDWE